MSHHSHLSCFPPLSTLLLGAGSSQPKARCSAAFLFAHPPLPFRHTALCVSCNILTSIKILVLQNQVHTSRKCCGPTHPLQLALDDLQEPRAMAWADQCFALLPIICPVHTTLTTYNYSLSQDFSPLRVV